MRSTRFVAVLIALVGLITTAVAARPGTPPEGTFFTRSFENCGGDCQGCGLFKTRLIIWKGEWWPYPYGCTQAPCPLTCQPMLQAGELPLEETVAMVEAAVGTGDAEALSRLLSEQPRLEINPARGMVQAIGCDDAVVATIPLSPGVLQILAEE